MARFPSGSTALPHPNSLRSMFGDLEREKADELRFTEFDQDRAVVPLRPRVVERDTTCSVGVYPGDPWAWECPPCSARGDGFESWSDAVEAAAVEGHEPKWGWA